MKNIDTKKEIINSLAEGFKLRKVKGSKDNLRRSKETNKEGNGQPKHRSASLDASRTSE
jgi:hypothetical protein